MKHTNSFKIRLIAVTGLMSLTCMVHANPVNVGGTYQQISRILEAIKNEANNPNINMSNTYSGKLLNNVESAKNDADSAAAIAPRGQGSRGQGSSGGLSVLIRLAATAADADVIHSFSAEAQQNIATELDGSIDGLEDQDEVDDANAVLNALGAGGSPVVKMTNTPRGKRNSQYQRQPTSVAARLTAIQRSRQTGTYRRVSSNAPFSPPKKPSLLKRLFTSGQ